MSFPLRVTFSVSAIGCVLTPHFLGSCLKTTSQAFSLRAKLSAVPSRREWLLYICIYRLAFFSPGSEVDDLFKAAVSSTPTRGARGIHTITSAATYRLSGISGPTYNGSSPDACCHRRCRLLSSVVSLCFQDGTTHANKNRLPAARQPQQS